MSVQVQPDGIRPPAPTNSHDHCSPHPVQLTIVRKVKAIPDGDFVVKDTDGKIVFKIKDTISRDQKILLDRAGQPILTLRRKVLTAHKRWQVFRGESTDPKDLIFSAKSRSIFYLKAKLDVFLATNKTEKACDFNVRGSYAERSTVIYAGSDVDSAKVVAQMHDRRHVAPNLLLGKEDCALTVSPGVDYASMVALLLILDQIDNEGRDYATGVAHASLPIILIST